MFPFADVAFLLWYAVVPTIYAQGCERSTREWKGEHQDLELCVGLLTFLDFFKKKKSDFIFLFFYQEIYSSTCILYYFQERHT